MLRITSGTAKGKRLALPTGQKITAVKEVVKLAVFAILGDKIIEAICLDLYAGSGNLGIEALSRGAAHCDLVDESKAASQVIQKNLANCQLENRATIIWDEALKFLANTTDQYDIIFADPYYTELNHRHLIKLAVERLKASGTLFLFSAADQPPIVIPKELTIPVDVQSRKYGKTLLSMLTRRA
ncbi:MAG: RsmD family RNA methyltransferase [bacterium]